MIHHKSKKVKLGFNKTGSCSEIETQLQFEKLITGLSTMFINLPSSKIDHEIETAQSHVCRFLHLDLSSLWQWSPDSPEMLSLTHLYRPLGGLPVPDQMSANEFFPWALKQVLAGKVIARSSVDGLPSEAERDKKMWNYFGIRSSVLIPLSVGGGPIFGALSFNAIKKSRTWPKVILDRLQLVAQVFANALARKSFDRNLLESQDCINLAADSANAGLWAWNYKTNTIWVTEKTRYLYGFSPEEVVTGDRFYSTLHPDDLIRVKPFVEKTFKEGFVVRIEYRIVLPDKSIRWISVRAQAYLTASGKPDRMTGVSVDISKQIQNESELSRLRLELAHHSRLMTMSELSAFLAHEINQPLGAILNNASAVRLLLDKNEEGHKEIWDIVEDIIRDSKRAGDVIRRIRGMVRKRDLQSEILDMNTLIEEVLDLLKGHIRMSDVLLHLELDPTLPIVRGDSVLLRQVLMNIVTNALEAMSESPDRELTICSTRTVAGQVTIRIIDSGRGIAEGKKEEIFKSFLTTKKEGLGMGLRICWSIIHEHGGKIWAEDNPLGGAIVSLSLPTDTKEPPEHA